MKKLNIIPILYLSISILYLELIMKNIITKNIINNEIILLIIFLLPLVLLLTILTKAFNKIVNKIILFITMILLTVYRCSFARKNWIWCWILPRIFLINCWVMRYISVRLSVIFCPMPSSIRKKAELRCIWDGNSLKMMRLKLMLL